MTYRIVRIVNDQIVEIIANDLQNVRVCQNMCRDYLTEPTHIGERLQVQQRETDDDWEIHNDGQNNFDFTSKICRNGRHMMTVFREH